eukprot:TRINITY_DN7113_c0_g2_i1.p1 TRINITY_DN7113_c0_g2~~TRINITY_DN7113_c0_g2_i1.p1  ORF type:complete len:542 (-),score=76.90 TRINITY_DN7113_c0_g2_i1:40-1665(-)
MASEIIWLFALCAVIGISGVCIDECSGGFTVCTYNLLKKQTQTSVFPGDEEFQEVLYPGNCSCPTNCFASMGRGVCIDGGCACTQGFKGADCSLVNCTSSSSCNGNGVCSTEGDCVCDPAHPLNDCSGDTVTLAPVVQTLNGSVYSSLDKYGDNHPIFNDSTIAQIHFTIQEEDLLLLLSPRNELNRRYRNVSMSFDNGIIQTMRQVGIRIQGDASRQFAKKSWKVSFEDDKWHHTAGFYLKSAAFDSSFIRERLSMAVLKSLVSPASRGSYAVVYINELLFGLFHLLEDVDNTFLKSRFGNDDGLLYKCYGPLIYQGNDTGSYNESYLAETDAAQNYTKLIELARVLNLNPKSYPDWPQMISAVLDIDALLRVLVYESATSAWDGIAQHANNYYLYWNPTVEKFQLFRHDLDCAFGLLLNGSMELNIYFTGLGYSPMTSKILNIPAFKTQFEEMYCELISKYFNLQSPLLDLARQLHQMVIGPAMMDYWHNLDFGWSLEDFVVSLNTTVVLPYERATYGIEEFMEGRYMYVAKQLACSKW